MNKGLAYGVAAYLLWGFFPLYLRLLRPAGAVEILAHRIVWSLLLVALITTATRTWRRAVALVRQPRRLGLVTLAAVTIAVNWGTYIYGVNAERVVETSLGYFINPLVTVLLGVLVLRERLRVAQWVAIGVGALAVGVLAVDYGHVPWLALVLAASFGLYGLIKKHLAMPAADGLLWESALLTLPGLAYLGVIGAAGTATFGTVSAGHSVLLALAGVATAVPLLFFAAAANRLPLSVMGVLQYLAPILQLAVGVLIFHEPMPPARLAGFALVWLALIVFTADGIRAARAASRAPAAPAPATPAPATATPASATPATATPASATPATATPATATPASAAEGS